MNLAFDTPTLLLLALLAIPLAALGWWVTAGMDHARRLTVVGLRTLVMLLLAACLAGPQMLREHDELTVVAVVDVSGSVRRFAEVPSTPGETTPGYATWIRDWLGDAAAGKRERDRLGVVVFDGEATATLAPAGGTPPEPTIDLRRAEGTAIEDGLRLGLAMLPRDTAGRLVLVSDGNATRGNIASAVELAAAGRREADGRDASATGSAAAVPIDVLPVVYRVPGDVRVAEIVAPTTAQPGQVVNVRVVMESARPASGRLTADIEGVPVDLNGADRPGRAREISLPSGRSVIVLPMPLGTTPINRITVSFLPDDIAADALADNNSAVAITATPGEGRILLVSRGGAAAPPAMAELLASQDLEFELLDPGLMPTDLLSLQDHDLVILDDVAAAEISSTAQEALARHVSDLGGGLLMLGGFNSFGAGGWAGTPVAEVLPLELDPPADLVLPTAALVLVLDESGSMARDVAGARATQQQVANESAARAIESLRSESLVGVIAFSSGPRTVVDLRRNDEPQVISEAIRAITPGGGTDIGGALLAAERMIGPVNVDRKYVVLLTDGRSSPGNLLEVADRMAEADVTITTIGVGDDVDDELLEDIATRTGGEYIRVLNPTALPRVLVESVQLVNRPLIKESSFIPVVRATGSTIGGDLAAVPPLGGLVITAPRPEPDAVIEATHPDGEPLLARWQAGLGRVTAFTSDFGRDWTDPWPRNPAARAFMLRLIRETVRPRANAVADLGLTIEDGRLRIGVDAVDEDGPMDLLVVEGTVFTPTGSMPVRLRQVGPGRYEADAPADADGEYVVALAPRTGRLALPPVVGGIATRRGIEFARLDSDLRALDGIVEATGGRRLDPEDPGSTDLFDRTGLPRTISLRPIWPLLTGLLLAAYLADVATRRIAWSGTAIRGRLATRMAHLRSSQRRGQAAAATAAALRSRSARDRDAREAATAGGSVPSVVRRGTPAATPPPRDTAPAARVPGPPVAPPATAPAATAPTATAPAAAAPPTPPSATPPTEPPAEPGSVRESLLAAKRRARKQLDGGSDG